MQELIQAGPSSTSESVSIPYRRRDHAVIEGATQREERWKRSTSSHLTLQNLTRPVRLTINDSTAVRAVVLYPHNMHCRHEY